MTSTSTDREFRTIGVVGLGTMGAGIAEVLARNGYQVVGVEASEEAAGRGQQHLQHSTDRAVKRGKLDRDGQQELLDRITLTTNLSDVKDADLVVEAVAEQLGLKQDLFRQLDSVVRPETILATNTSSLSVTEISTATTRPGRVVGLHFFNPAPVQRLVEVVKTVVTEPDVLDDVARLARSLRKTPVVCGDRAGFIANSLLFGYLNHAATMFEAKYATREDIDAAMRYGCGYPMGPLALLDLIGLDTAYEILETMYRQDRDRLHAPSPILKQLVTAGMLGRKSGRGFYTYEAPHSPVVVDDALTPSKGDEPQVRTQVRRVGVVGNGTMATGIVEVFARAGYEVVYAGRSEEEAAAAHEQVRRSLDSSVAAGRLAEASRDEVLDRVSASTGLHGLVRADLVIEAVSEELAAKEAVFAELDGICGPGTILATTTSSLPVISLARATSRPERVLGMHFFDPAPVIQLVEVVSTVSTADDVAETARAVCAAAGKVVVSCADRAGFIVNALLFPYLNDAVRMLQANYASADDIDTAMKYGCALPMGPFELLDVVGNDVSLAIQRELYLEYREPGLAPAPLLEHLVTAGYLGRKTGRGFRDYGSAR